MNEGMNEGMNEAAQRRLGLNMFAPTRTLLHTYNHHDHRDHHDHHHHQQHHHIITSRPSSH